MTIRALSFGAGVQSTAMLVLAARNEIDYSLALFSNVGDDSEHPATLAYFRAVAKPYAQAHGIELVELRKRPRGQETTLMQVLMRPESRSIGIPVRMAGNGAPGRRNCTSEFKISRISGELKRRGASASDPAIVGLGISLDEYQRMRTESGIAWQRNAYPLIDLRLSRSDCVAIIEREGLPVPPRSSCFFCLAGETEVVTRDGIKQIRDLAGSDVDILVPKIGVQGGLSSVGTFQTVPVRSFGSQQLWRIDLVRGRTQKTIFATGEHRWIVESKPIGSHVDEWRTTQTLRPGDSLHALRSTSRAEEKLLPFAVAQGFVFGDGTRGQGERPATLTIHPGKEALLPFFELCSPTPAISHTGKPYWFVYGMPRTWKFVPDIHESRSFLMSWLAGWFAADGHVSSVSSSILYSAKREHLEFARSALNILGARTYPIRERVRRGFGGLSVLYSLGFYVRDVPPNFFLLPHHHQRVTKLIKERPYPEWTVQSVVLTDRIEEVFCATVDGAGAFGLADGLMTGNCPMHSLAEWQRQRRDEPELFAKSVALERHLNERRAALGKDAVYLTSADKPLDEAVVDTGQLDLFTDAACDIGGYCMS